MSAKRKRRPEGPIQCGDGIHTSNGQCDATIPNGEYETMKKYNWGWIYQYDPGMPEGVPGAYYACPDHKWEDS